MNRYSAGRKRRNRAAVQKRRTVLITVTLTAAVLAVLLFFLYPQLRDKISTEEMNNTDQTRAGMETHETNTEEPLGPSKMEELAHLGEVSDSAQGIISYKGKKFRYNDHLSNYLFLGIDTSDDIQLEKNKEPAGQSDSIFLASYDRLENRLRMLAIPRDTMTRIALYNGKEIYWGTTEDHLALQYAYGDGKFFSCELTRDAVSHLLYEVPILGYVSINRASIPTLADAVDGIPLTVPDDSLAEADSAFQAGADVVITSENAELFLRHRDTSRHQQALVRMDRQKVFIRAFADRVRELQAKNPHTITDIYEKMKPYMVTNMSNDLYLELAGASLEGGIVTIPGEGVATEKYDEYHVDEDALFELILDVFYREVTES